MKKIQFFKLSVLAICMGLFLVSCETDSDDDLITALEEDEIAMDDDEDIDATNAVSSEMTWVITEWNDTWLELDRYATGMRPNATARALAYIHLAGYEVAVHQIPDGISFENTFGQLSIEQNRLEDDVDVRLALNTCYAEVLDHFMINIPRQQRNLITQTEDRLRNTLEDDVSEESIANSQRWGRHVAARIIAFAQTDTEAEEQILDPQPTSYEPPVGDGFWTYSAEEERGLFPYWGEVRTFVISPDETSTITPIAYSEDLNSEYYEQMLEVYEVNNEARETNNEQLWIAEFWSDDVEGLMMSPPGRQISIANQLIKQFDLGHDEALVLLQKLGFSLNDAAVSTWADKYEYLVMRPNVYIHEFIDPDFQTNLFRFIFWPNPTFPGYPSGHSTFASAAAGIFINQFGDTVDFTDRSHEGRTEFRGNPRQFGSFSDMAEENAYSRIPLGVHIRMDCDEGLRLGYEIAEAVNGFVLVQ
ncbi:vanadium-dependent haloperoxidase [Flagellimonas sp.]|uniref:vanadium-dependent haloperoxidase n=1 Tax=Flagellimonas sp. TaxID=2058762 RepID=UPI003F49B511